MTAAVRSILITIVMYTSIDGSLQSSPLLMDMRLSRGLQILHIVYGTGRPPLKLANTLSVCHGRAKD